MWMTSRTKIEMKTEIITPRPVTLNVTRFKPETMRYWELWNRKRLMTLTQIEATELIALETALDVRIEREGL